MKYSTDAYTDIGVKKKVNQDALLVKKAQMGSGKTICFSCVCDGMGGLSCGEIASSAFVHRMDEWFKIELPQLFSRNDYTEQLDNQMDNKNIYFRLIERSWNNIVQEMNGRLQDYGNKQGIRLGTTVVALIIIENEYLAMNVGDSRVYRINGNNIDVITHDQSYVQQQIDLGRMTPEEARVSDKKSMLLQCIGASEVVVPEFYSGRCNAKDNYMLCSDGLWRRLEPEDMTKLVTKKKGLAKMTELVKERGETDNISGLLVSV
jgi:serine/threonine protein phosphatase PrpC